MQQDPADDGKRATESSAAGDAPKPDLPTAAERALSEAALRRRPRERAAAEQPEEFPARGGLDPTRYGDWEKNGIASDF